MIDSIKTLRELFEKCIKIEIPIYQRAYSWDKEQCEQFFNDLVEQDGNSYHYGIFIFEKDDDKKYFIVDGQQRLTTAVLFFASLTKFLSEENKDIIKKTYLSGLFSTVNEDNEYFERIIQNLSCGDKRAETISQIKIKEGFDFFCKKLDKIVKSKELEKIDKIQKSIENARIRIFEVDNKAEASQIFEYQNNRGIHASDFEIIKAYLFNQIFIDPNYSEVDIDEIRVTISFIYRNLEAISEHFPEDDILWCWFYLFENTIDKNIEGIKWFLSNENEDKPVKDICKWIKDFFINFEKITAAAKKLLAYKTSTQILNLFLIGDKPYWKVVMLAVLMKEEKITNEQLNKLAKLFEILWFKYEYRNRKKDPFADSDWVYNYFNDSSVNKLSFEELCKKIKSAIVSGFEGKWGEFKKAIPNYLAEKEHFWFKNLTRYVLWQYDNNLRIKAGLPKLGNRDYRKYNTIEHIQSQSTERSYIHNLGNLTLLTQSDNSKACDNDFINKKKKVYYKYYNEDSSKNILLFQFRDIISNSSWREQEVNERFRKIKNFINLYFNQDNKKL